MDALSAKGAVALEYAAQGFAVFPVFEMGPGGACACGRPDCSSPGKHPRVSRGLKEASKDPEVVRSWWTQWPEANIGIATGSPSGIFVMDVDIKNNGHHELARLIEEHGAIPDTRICQTGGGGFHVYFRLPPGQRIPNSAGKIAPGIDVRGDGGYVVAPPSNHYSGGCYEWN